MIYEDANTRYYNGSLTPREIEWVLNPNLVEFAREFQPGCTATYGEDHKVAGWLEANRLQILQALPYNRRREFDHRLYGHHLQRAATRAYWLQERTMFELRGLRVEIAPLVREVQNA